ncbi:hypothetical protein SNEBB_000517 [Seison nebaliae]|nr:hypothetical protein SNEBB_000517 [Seison nebaliae]
MKSNYELARKEKQRNQQSYIDRANEKKSKPTNLQRGSIVRRKLNTVSKHQETSKKLNELYSETYEVLHLFENGNVEISSTKPPFTKVTVHPSNLVLDEFNRKYPKRKTNRRYNREREM